jgi:hypothetical protein
VRETPGTISVFEGPNEAVAVQSAVAPKTETDDPDSVSQSDPLVHHAQGATTETDPVTIPADKPIPPEIETLPVESAAELQPLADATAAEESFAVVSDQAEPAAPASPPMDEIERGAVVKASGELIGGVERALTGAGADFTSLFQTARLELADDYTFLDPMSGEFTYSKSVVTLTGETPIGPYVIGLSEALRRVVNSVATGDRARRVRERVALELFSVMRKRNEILARSGFLPQLDRIAGTKVL